jgi:hypothetical protein
MPAQDTPADIEVQRIGRLLLTTATAMARTVPTAPMAAIGRTARRPTTADIPHITADIPRHDHTVLLLVDTQRPRRVPIPLRAATEAVVAAITAAAEVDSTVEAVVAEVDSTAAVVEVDSTAVEVADMVEAAVTTNQFS